MVARVHTLADTHAHTHTHTHTHTHACTRAHTLHTHTVLAVSFDEVGEVLLARFAAVEEGGSGNVFTRL